MRGIPCPAALAPIPPGNFMAKYQHDFTGMGKTDVYLWKTDEM